MFKIARQQLMLTLIFIFIFMTASCTVKLSPDYDKDLSTSLSSINTEMMVFFASIDEGTHSTNFGDRKQTYSKIKGKLEALVIDLKSRPTPSINNMEAINAILKANNIPILPNDMNSPPSVESILSVSKTIKQMESTDKSQGLTSFEIQAFKNQINIYISQAITYENFLKNK